MIAFILINACIIQIKYVSLQRKQETTTIKIIKIMARIDSFFSFKVQKSNLDEFDKAAIRCGMNPDEYGKVEQDGSRNWHAYCDNGKEVATWITYNGRLCFAGLMKVKDFEKGGRSLWH
jgi:hypothetical protein